jgi:HSP20 family protein
MSLIPWRNKRQESERGGLTSLADFRHEMDRLFDSFFHEPFAWPHPGGGGVELWNPALDVSETDQEVVVRAEMPGLDPEDLNINVVGNSLVLSGEKKEEQEHKGEGYWHAERRFGAFRREVPLPRGVDAEKVSADYAKGVLTVHLAKSPDAAPKRVPVKAS